MDHQALQRVAPLKTKLVCEVSYDHFSAGRFRHAPSFCVGVPKRGRPVYVRASRTAAAVRIAAS